MIILCRKSKNSVKKLSSTIDGSRIQNKDINKNYKKYIIKNLEKDIVDSSHTPYIYSKGLALKENLIDPDKARYILDQSMLKLILIMFHV